MAVSGALTEQDVAAVRGAAAAARPVTVWFTAAAVGVPVGGSAKVVAVGDTAEGDFIQVRPAGSRDTMFCSPTELTRTRPARRPAGGGAAKPAQPTRAPAAVPAGRPVSPEKATTPAGRPVPPKRATAAEVPAAPAAPQSAVAAEAPAASAGAARPAPAAAGPRRRADRSGEIAVSLAATADGEWTVEVLVGRKRVVPSTPVPAADVATAARSLPPAVAEAIESLLQGARQRQRDRVEQLRAELDAAQRVLDQLGV